MIEALIGKIPGSVFQGTVLCGLVPAALMMTGMDWLTGATPDVFGLVRSCISGHCNVSSDLEWFALGWVLLSAGLYISRSLLLTLVADLPGSLLRTLRSRRLRKAWNERLCLQTSAELAALRATAFYWLLNKRKDPPVHLPSDLEAKFCSPTLDAVDQAFRLLETRASQGEKLVPLSQSESVLLRDGVYSLYALGRQNPQEASYVCRHQRWTELLAAKGNVAAVELLKAELALLQREWAAAYVKKERFAAGIWLAPTALGNALASLDDYSSRRYRIDTSTLWTRLWWILPAAAQERVSSNKVAIEALVNTSIVFAALSLVSAGHAAFPLLQQHLLAPLGDPARRAPLLSLATALLSWLTYRCAVLAALRFQSTVASLIDVYRLKLLQALGFKPATVAEEGSLFAELRNFFTEAGPRDGKRALVGPNDREGATAEQKAQ
jgi:hypothetical protein